MGVATMVLTAAGSLGLAGAAGLADLVAARWRIRQQTRRAMPGLAGTRDDDWRFGDRKLAAQVFVALCDLRHQLTTQALPVPPVAVGLAAHDRLILRLAEPAAAAPPTPWRPEPGEPARRSWMVDTAQLRQFRPGPAACPALVAVGRQEQWTVLIDLGQAPGPVALAGDPAQCRRLLDTFGFGLATSPWSRQVTLLAAGFTDLLPVPTPGRIRYLDSPADVLSHLAGGMAGMDDSPLVVLLAEPPDPTTGEQLAKLCRQRPGRLVVLGPPPLPQPGWNLTITPQGELQLPWLGLTLEPLHTPLSTSARRQPTTPPALPSTWRTAIRDLSAPVLTDRDRDRIWPAPVEVRVLGPLEIRAPGTVSAPYRAMLTDLLVLAALHPDGVPNSLVTALLPAPEAGAELARRLHDWLGPDEQGLPRLRSDGQIWRLSADVRVDLRLFRALTADQTVGWPQLASALALIRGELCAGANLGPVAARCLSRAAAEVHPLILRAVRQAADLADQHGQMTNVEWTLRRGLACMPQVEGLWRSLLQFQAQHRPQAVATTIDQMLTTLSRPSAARDQSTRRRGRSQLERATVTLLNQLGYRQALRSASTPPR